MAEGYLSSQVNYPSLPPAIYPFLLYRITIPVYEGMPLSTFNKIKVSKIIARNHTKLAKILPKCY